MRPFARAQIIIENVLISLHDRARHDQIGVGLRINHEAQVRRDHLGKVGQENCGARKFIVDLIRAEETLHETFDIGELIRAIRTCVIETAEPRAHAAEAPHVERDFRKLL
jgi:hypothetical protein